MPKQNVVIIGAGITGLTVAERLSRSFRDKVILIEKEHVVGGLAATFSEDNIVFDLGSHRIHENSSPRVIKYIEDMIGEQLPRKKRHGKLYFKGVLFDYPPNIFNMLRLYSPRDMVKAFASYLSKFSIWMGSSEVNYETAMIRTIGKNAYEKIYKDYARKIWGKDPQKISIEGMQRRKTLLDLKSLSGAFRRNRYFYYPRQGIGHIANKLEESILNNNARIIKGEEPKKILFNKSPEALTLSDAQGRESEIPVSILISTIPLDSLYNLFFNSEKEYASLEWRDLRLLYIHIDEELQSENETYYFPSSEIILGRVSNIKRYSNHFGATIKKTLLTVEIPSTRGDRIWNMEEKELLELCLKDLIKVRVLDRPPKVLRYFTRSIVKAYPIYQIGWKERFSHIYNRLDKVQKFFSIGRKGLFLHCNIDHCMIQGLELANFILQDKIDNKELWSKKVAGFMNFSARD